MELSALTALSPLDGRYHEKVALLREHLSEFGLIKARVRVEIHWLKKLSSLESVPEVDLFDSDSVAFLNKLESEFSVKDAQEIKEIERRTNHDVKAVEYFLRQRLSSHARLSRACEFIHFACTSEDINNLAYALMIKGARDEVLVPVMVSLIGDIKSLAALCSQYPMLARTHGQSASPTTMGKELVNVAFRLERQLNCCEQSVILGKFNGAVGNYNAHLAAYPELDWEEISKDFVSSLGIEWNPLTTQIEPHDCLAELFQAAMRFNTVLLDFCRDTWTYVSLGYFRQKVVAGEVGSSTMPHKVNPIDFENAEGNLGVGNALLDHLAQKLPISRMQRDLSDSTALRTVGMSLGHSLLAYQSCRKGISKLEIVPARLKEDLDKSWEVIAEALQTIMRRHGIEEPYEKLKEFTRGKSIGQEDLKHFIEKLPLSEKEKSRVLALTPQTYTGNAREQAQKYLDVLKPKG